MDQNQLSAYEKEQVRLKEEELALQERELVLEHRKSWLTLATVVVTVVAALLTYWGTRQAQLNQAETQSKLQANAAQDAFDLKAAEIVMAGRGSYDAKGRAMALKILFGDRIRGDLGSNLDPKTTSWGRDSKSELLTLLAAASTPEHRRAIVKAYKALLPEDDSIKRLPSDL